MADIRIKKGKTGKGAPLVVPVVQTPLPPTPGAGVRNPIFDSDPTVYAEAKRQLKLIDEELNAKDKNGHQQYLLHVLRGILDADSRGIVIRTANREEFLGANAATIPQTEQLLVELEQAGYLKIVTRRPKNCDYRPSQKTYDTWNGVRLYEPISPPMRPVGYGMQRSEEHYLVPFDARTYLDRAPSRKPQDVPVSLSDFLLIPCREGFIGVSFEHDSRIWGNGRELVLVDLRDHELHPGDYKTAYHERIYRYMDIPTLGSKLDGILGEIPRSCDTLVPRYKVQNEPLWRDDASVIFRDTRGQHYLVPEEFHLYLYNNYYGEDLDIQVSSKPVGGYPGSGSGGSTYDDFLIVVRRCGSKPPLLLYRFGQFRQHLATIT